MNLLFTLFLVTSSLFGVGTAHSDELSVDQPKYEIGEEIEVKFKYYGAEKKDWVGIYDSHASPEKSEPILWLFTCGTQHCNHKDDSDTLTFGYGYPMEAGKEHFPLEKGDYVAVLMRGLHQPYCMLDHTGVFHVEEKPRLTTDEHSYGFKEKIRVSFRYSRPRTKDWVGIYRSKDDPHSDDPRIWLYTCGTQKCHHKDNSDTLTFGPGGPDESSNGKVPLPSGDYFVVLARDKPKPPYHVIAESKEFHIEDQVELYTNRHSYKKGQTIKVSFRYSNPKKGDWVGIYSASKNPSKSEPKLYLYTCGTKHCHGKDGKDTLSFGYGYPNESDKGHFPLHHGEYVAVLARYDDKAPYHILAVSDTFYVKHGWWHH